jgi:hypothetical protein
VARTPQELRRHSVQGNEMASSLSRFKNNARWRHVMINSIFTCSASNLSPSQHSRYLSRLRLKKSRPKNNRNDKTTVSKRLNNQKRRPTGQCLRTLQHFLGLVLRRHYFHQSHSIYVGHPRCDTIRTVFSTVDSYSAANLLVKSSRSPVSLQPYEISVR